MNESARLAVLETNLEFIKEQLGDIKTGLDRVEGKVEGRLDDSERELRRHRSEFDNRLVSAQQEIYTSAETVMGRMEEFRGHTTRRIDGLVKWIVTALIGGIVAASAVVTLIVKLVS